MVDAHLPRPSRRGRPASLLPALLGGASLGLLLAAALSHPSASAAAPASICYQQLSGQASTPDIEQLRLDLDGVRASGFYRWIPWQKDRRVGRLQGRLASAGTARVLARFQQEGRITTAPLTIVFNGRQARISWDPPASSTGQPTPPPVVLPRHACMLLKPAPGL